MADKAIYDLPAATEIMPADLFVLEQSATAKKLTGQLLINWMTEYADGHGGIQTITKTSSSGTNPVVDTYTITYADADSTTFTVTNGVKGDTGDASYVHIKWAAQNPTADNQMSSIPDNWIGIVVNTTSADPTHYTDYQWYQYKGDTGDSIVSISRTSGTGSPGTTDTYTVYKDTTPASGSPTSIGTFGVYNGADSPIGYIGSITLSDTWTASGSYYTQSVVVDGVSVGNDGKVDLQPTADVIAQMVADGTVGLYIQNNNGSLTAYAVGNAPTQEMTVQCVVGNIAVEE